jgi:FkbM family methyltransferase
MLAGLRRSLRRNRLARSAIESRPARLAARHVRASLAVERPTRFLAFELLRRRGVAGHRLRASGLAVHLRHGTRDIVVFREIFGVNPWPNVYEPPPEVEAILRERPAPRIVDLGGNIGLFGLFALGRWPGSTVESFEPDPTNLPLLRRAIEANRLESRWSVHTAAVSDAGGRSDFVSGLNAESQLAGVGDPGARVADARPLSEGEQISVPVVDLFATITDPIALLKIDIEGAEWAILQDPRLVHLPADAIVLEWHAMGSPDADAHGAARRLLASAGYEHLRDVEAAGQTGVVWAWRS